MATIGIICGIFNGVCVSLSYLFARSYQLSRPNGLARLMVISHLLQGLLSAVLLVLLWRDDVPPLADYIVPLAAMTGLYLVGHVGLFFAIHHADASRIAPLMGFKVVVLAAIAVGFAGQYLLARQWLAVFLTVAGVLILNYVGGRMPWRALVGVLVACVGYSVSDIYIQRTIAALAPLPLPWAAAFAGFMSYVGSAVIAAALLPWLGPRAWREGGLSDWRDAVPYAAAWYLGMLVYFLCVALTGVVFANILQSTRAIWAVVLGALVVRWGWNHLEQHTTRGVFVRRIAAAVMIVAAIALYSSARSAPARPETPHQESPAKPTHFSPNSSAILSSIDSAQTW